MTLRKRLLAVLCFASLLVAARDVRAQGAEYSTALEPLRVTASDPSEAELEARRGGLRLRAGVGGGFAFYVAAGRTSAFGFGVDGALGAQFGDRWALYGQLHLASIGVSSIVRGSVLGEWQPVNWFGLGAGVGALYAYAGSSCAGLDCRASEDIALTLPVQFAFSFGPRLDNGVTRSAFRVALQAGPTWAVSTAEGSAYRGGLVTSLSLGWVLH